MTTRLTRWALALAIALPLAWLVGCDKPAATTKDTKQGDKPGPVAKGDDKKGESNKEITKDESKHSGWWCDEHGMPEEECSMCSPKVAGAFKAKGDWCDKHDRAKSQCFVCTPKLKEQFAAKYRAKYGKEPPPTEDEEKKDDKKPDDKKKDEAKKEDKK